MALRARALDEARVRKAVAAQAASMVPENEPAMKKELTESIVRLTAMFAGGGMESVVAQLEKAVPAAEREKAMESYIMVLQSVLGSLYVDQLRAEGVAVDKGISDTDARFFDEALEAMAAMGTYGSPLFVEVTDFQHHEASGLQITRAPGQDIVYLGCVMLMAGVFFMFYLHHRRVWVSVAAEEQGSRVLLAGSGNRDRMDFGKEFEGLRERIAPDPRKTGAA
jgi:cytochrome c biogenesis protein